MIGNTPSTKSEVGEIVERVGLIKETHYGDEFTLSSKDQTTAFAYTPSKHQLHVDIPYYDQMPGVSMLHCVTQSSSGGANTLADGFYVAELLRERNPNFMCCRASESIGVITASRVGSSIECYYEHLL